MPPIVNLTRFADQHRVQHGSFLEMPRPSLNPTRVALSLLLLSLAGCSGERRSAASGPEPADAPRPFVPVTAGRWIGNGICYGPHRDGQRPGGTTPSAREIREDLRLMAPHWRLVRTYGASEFGQALLEGIRAERLDMKVLLGVWVAPEERPSAAGGIEHDAEAAADNAREVEAAISLAAAYPDLVVGICVGNETQVSWSPHPCPLELLIAQVRRLRAAVAVPVTAADDYQYWLTSASQALARELDFLTVHAHPMWNGQSLDTALPWLREQLAAVRLAHPGRPLVIGETGWATSVAGSGEQAQLIKGQAGETEQASFYSSLLAWAQTERLPLFVFEAFDENWKGGSDPAEVEKHWGLFYASRSPKRALREGTGAR